MTRPLSHMEQRMELLHLGEGLGWPRIGRLRAGQGNWEGAARSDHRHFIPLLRAAKIRVENLHGELESDLARTVLYGDVLRGLADEIVAAKAEKDRRIDTRPDPIPDELPDYAEPEPTWPALPPIRAEMVAPGRYTVEMRRANLAKARAAKKAKVLA